MFAQILLQWFRENGRELPWRQTRDPYAIWLSEIILQQTQVKQGWDYWERFMHRWPTVEALAAATEDEVLREWQGLGYYSRARNLHYAAKQIVALGHFPDTLDDIRKLKGVGDYTAAAIGSFAFGLPAAVVDGNVYRVLARHFGIDTPINTTEGKKTFTALAQSLLPSDNCQLSARPKDACYQRDARIFNYQLPQVAAYNQAIMDFGAIQCTPSSPRCQSCPLMETCVAFRSNLVSDLPVKQKTFKVRERHLIYIYIRCNGMTAIHRRGPGDIWQGLYEPWLVDTTPVGAVLIKQNVKHVLTHRILLADFYLLEVSEKPSLPPDYIWIPESDLDSYAVPRLIEKFLQDFRPI
jgi:A/G-specific adenine glycosylase